MTQVSSPLPADWGQYLNAEFQQDYMQRLKTFLREQKDAHKIIYPHSQDWFKAFHFTPLQQVKVVILGQDPYHNPEQAHGLCFSVPPHLPAPPSLVNIYKELYTDLGIPAVHHGCLVPWAQQGVLLLNSVLTVEKNQAASHQGKGWETFTDKVIQVLNQEKEHLVFLLWGAYAQRKAAQVDTSRHLVLKAPHPSPLAAHRGFFGCRHFSQANAYLQAQQKTPIEWRLPEQVSL